ncbi:CAP domain-containing protein [uncultured Roseobacter sp.]|uniref:CAP domain-containing protein n=1 Tax=uncultured Roseobacter sp. TaxID=114847 RepID=UPI0026197A2A|nr:CAP domain-containing protein [uncultured Roseobacter sp.]
MSRASELEQQMLGLINEERTSRGLNPVELELRLNESSEDHSQWMLEEDQFSHTGENGTSAGDRMRNADFEFEGAWSWGENIAFQSERGEPGLADDVVDLHNSLMNSPGHRANILNPDYEVIGLGIEVGEFDGFEAVMVTQNFASTDAELQLDQEGAASEPETEEPTEPAPDPEEPETETPAPDPETPDPDTGEETPDPESETEEPEPEPEEPVAEAPNPNNTPETEEPEPDPETPEPDPEPETPEPEPETPTGEPEPEPEIPEPETPTPDPDPEPETPEPEPETPDVVGEGPCLDDNTFAQLQFFVTGLFAALFDEEFAFTWDGGDEGEPQTITFDVDEFFEGLFDTPEGDDGMDQGDDDMMMADEDVAGDCESGFRFVEEWDCLA